MTAEAGLNRSGPAATAFAANLSSSTSPTVSGANLVCEPTPNWYTISFQIFVLPSLFVNLLLFTAAVFDSGKLQRLNYLFASVISTLLSNFFYLVMLEWILLDNYTAKPQYESHAGRDSFAKNVWVFQEAVTVTMPFLICGNIVSLTYVTVNSATYVGRVANVEDTQQAEKRFRKIRRVTLVLILTSWSVPLFLTVAGMVSMNCVNACVCPSTNYKGTICPNQTNCSTFWAPVTKTYLWINVGLWLIAVTGLILFVVSAMNKYWLTTTQPKQSLNMANRSVNNGTAIPEFDVGTNDNAESNFADQVERPTLTRRGTKRPLMQRLNSRLRFAVTQTGIYVACSALFIAAISIDSVDPEANEFLLFALCRITMYIYTTVSPVVMIWYLPVLKSSLSKLFYRLKSCCKKKPPRNREQI